MSVRGRPSLENIGLQILCHYIEVVVLSRFVLMM